MSLRRIGPITVDHRDPTLTWTSIPDGHGVRSASISGVALTASVTQLDELIANADRRITFGQHTGVLEFVDFDDEPLVGPCRGWYLLTGFRKSVEYRWSVTPYTAFTLDAAYLPTGVEPVVPRSARARSNVHGLTPVAVVADPLWAQEVAEPFVPVPLGGTAFTREFDPEAHSTTLTTDGFDLTLYRAAFVGGADVLPSLVIPAPRNPDGDSTRRGSDVRVWDRRMEQEVYGPSHGFRRETDISVTNGLVRFRVGNRGVIPSVHVEAFRNGSWRDQGYLVCSVNTADVLRGARVVRVTPEHVTVVLTARLSGDISLSLHRGARSVEVRHGADYPPYTTVARSIGWRGLPPAVTASGVSAATGKFGKGLAVSGVVQFYWPEDQGTGRWGFSAWWKPTAASASQVDSGLLALIASDGSVVGTVTYTATDKKIRFTLGAGSVESAALTFSAGADIFVGVDFDDDEGVKLVTKVAAGTATVVTGSSVDPGADAFHSFAFGEVWTTYGSEPYGSGPYGGSQITEPLGGVIDNPMIFDGPLTAPEWATLAAGTDRLDGIPTPEGRIIWHAPLDARPLPLGSSVASGRRYEATAQNGSTRSPDEWGLTKGLATLEAAAGGTPFALTATGEHLNALALVATTASGDDLADHHAQYSAASEQEVRVR